jgi:hypothetical protein
MRICTYVSQVFCSRCHARSLPVVHYSVSTLSNVTGEFIRQDEEGEWIFPKSEEVLKKAGVLTIEEYIERRREQTIMKYAQTRNNLFETPHICKTIYIVYGKCKSSRKNNLSPSDSKGSRFLGKQVSSRTQVTSVCREELTDESENQAQDSSSNPNTHQVSTQWLPRINNNTVTSFSLRGSKTFEMAESTAVDRSYAKRHSNRSNAPIIPAKRWWGHSVIASHCHYSLNKKKKVRIFFAPRKKCY